MAAVSRQVLDWHRLALLSRNHLAQHLLPLRRQRQTAAAWLHPLTAAAGERSHEEASAVGSRKYTRWPECRTDVPRGLPEKPKSPVKEGAAGREVVTRALVDMGFNDAHIGELLSIQPGPSPQQLLGITSELILLGVNPEPVCVALKNSPELLKLPIEWVKRRAGYLRKLGLSEGKLKRVLHCCPEIFTMSQRDLASTVRVLQEKCLFTIQQVTEVLHRCPYILQESPADLEYKFQYAYFRMGIKHADVVKTGFLQYSLIRIKQRHIYLERLGRYQTPDKKGQTQTPNPLLKDIFRVSEADFLARTACSSAEEFEVFKKLLAREEEEGCESYGSDHDKNIGLDEYTDADFTDGEQ
ncbi:PREDICTED: mTERF domain-containing protein 2 [Elephantulus edwardii]|uniref:mTERF domain-containing protein 2 n=1 Tax=Elephantulus edwardii TaxID=28737 RepID=UPI0003F09A89|nr:PREDICTED: mTERF domain-containing protein 2 [Elephantulus edwardii]